jgi:hypothetical protein
MQEKLLKGILSASITFFVMIFITICISMFIGYKLITGRLEYNSNSARMTGTVVGTMLSNLRSELNEGLKKSGQKAFDMKWSAIFSKMTKDSKDRSDPFRIEEIFLLNRKGDIIAHSDITKMSKFFTDEKDKNDLLRTGGRGPGAPSSVKVISIMQNNGLMHPKLYEAASANFPDLMAEKYSVSVAVFPVDSDIANATLHIMLYNTTFPDFYKKLEDQVIRIILLDFGIAAFVSLLVMIIVLIVAEEDVKTSKNVKNIPKVIRTPSSEKLPQGMEIYEAEGRPVSGMGEAKPGQLRKDSVILDAIPLDDIRRGN